jgi:hypothetical protein
MATPEQAHVADLVSLIGDEHKVEPDNVLILDPLSEEFAERYTEITMLGDTVRRLSWSGPNFEVQFISPRDFVKERAMTAREKAFREERGLPISLGSHWQPVRGYVDPVEAAQQVAERQMGVTARIEFEALGRLQKLSYMFGVMAGRRSFADINRCNRFPDVTHNSALGDPYAIVDQTRVEYLLSLELPNHTKVQRA